MMEESNFPFFNTHIVPPLIRDNAKMLIVGGAPTYDEHLSQKIFSGSGGQLLDFCLVRAGIPKLSCSFDYIIQEQPLRNKLSDFITITSQGVVNGTSEEFNQYVTAFAERLKQYDINLIVAVGEVAFYVLTNINKTRLQSRRGSIYPCSFDPSIKVMALMSMDRGVRGDVLTTQLSIWDMKKAKRESLSKEYNLPEPLLITAPTFTQSTEYLEKCKQSRYVTFDIEGRDTVNCISFCYSSNHAISIPFVNKEHSNYYTLEEEYEIWKLIASILEDPKIIICNQNINYDASVLYRLYGIIVNNMEDTGIAQNILYPDFPKRLEFVCRMWTEFNYYKDEGEEYKDTGVINDYDQFWHYSALDAIIPYIAFIQQVKMLKKQGNWETYKRQRGSLEAVQFMQARGIKVDKEGIKSRAIELRRELKELVEAFQELTGEVTFTKELKDGPVTKTHVVNPSSTDDMRAYFYGKLKIRPYLLKGKPTLGEKALLKIAAAGKKGVEEAKLAIKIRSVKTILSNYFTLSKGKKTLLDPKDGRLRCSFNLAGTSSGRWSSSAFLFNIGRNLHNLPKKAENTAKDPFRKFLIADDGMVLCKADLSMAENRIVAYVAPDAKMINAFEQGVDLHKFTAGLILDKGENDVTKFDRDTVGKPCNHGGNYGMGAGKLSEQYGIPFGVAKRNLAKYLQTFRGIPIYHSWVTAALRKNRTLVNCLGRKRVFYGRVSGADEGGVNAFYFIPQSTVGDIINEGGIQATYYSDYTKQAELLLQVHDEIDFQFPLAMPVEKQWDMLCAIKRSLEVELEWNGRKWTIPADFEFGFNLWEMEELEGGFSKFKNLMEKLKDK